MELPGAGIGYSPAGLVVEESATDVVVDVETVLVVVVEIDAFAAEDVAGAAAAEPVARKANTHAQVPRVTSAKRIDRARRTRLTRSSRRCTDG